MTSDDKIPGTIEEKTPCLAQKRKMKMFFENENKRRFSLDILVMFLGVGAWLGVNGMYVQLPLLVETAPESWNLPSFMAVIVQIANIGPITYSLLRKFLPNVKDKYYIYFILGLGFTSMLLLSFLYQITTVVAGQPRSTVFLILVFFVALVGCTSSVLFYPYMRHYKDSYLISYLIGEGLSGFLPSILALIQGIGGNPECIVAELPNGNVTTELIYQQAKYSTQVFFIILSIILAGSFTSFVLLNTLKCFESEKVSNAQLNDKPSNGITEHSAKTTPSLLSPRYVILLILMSIVCGFGNGVFPSVQSYSCLPYGNTVYHLAVTLSSMANPLACFLAVFLPHTSNKAISFLSGVGAVVISYALATAFLSPTPPLVNTIGGEILMVLTWIMAVGLVSYIKLCISTIFRAHSGTGMFWCGAFSQLGSAIGSLIFFFLINNFNIFVQSDPCL